MSPIDSPATLSSETQPSVVTRAAEDTELVSGNLNESVMEAWNDVIDRSLIEWGRAAGALEDEEDFELPSRPAVDSACQLAVAFRDGNLPPPLRVLPDGNGGISFERFDEAHQETLNIHKDGTAELLLFQDCKLVERLRLR